MFTTAARRQETRARAARGNTVSDGGRKRRRADFLVRSNVRACLRLRIISWSARTSGIAADKNVRPPPAVASRLRLAVKEFATKRGQQGILSSTPETTL